MMARALLSRPSEGTARFTVFDTDVSHLTALSLYFQSPAVGRPSLSDAADELACRVHAALCTGGVCSAQHFTFSDFDRLMGWKGYAGDASASLRIALSDLARRIWCGLTGDEVCPIEGV